MNKPQDIIAAAAKRATEIGLPYAGALFPIEAHELMTALPGAAIVDVRTQAELYWVGRVPGAIAIEWSGYPGGALNPNFLEQFQAAVPDNSAPVMFLCRSGQRSHFAAIAATRAGYRNCFNILQGFEGDRDAQGHRNSIGGWRAAGLPWEQG